MTLGRNRITKMKKRNKIECWPEVINANSLMTIINILVIRKISLLSI